MEDREFGHESEVGILRQPPETFGIFRSIIRNLDKQGIRQGSRKSAHVQRGENVAVVGRKCIKGCKPESSQ